MFGEGATSDARSQTLRRMPTEDLTKRIYWRLLRVFGFNRLSWNGQFARGLWGQGTRSPHTITRVAQLCAGGKLVELGCGEGDLPHLLPRRCFTEYLGVDISDVAIIRAKQRMIASGLDRCDFEQGDMGNWRGTEDVSLILSEECLYYLTPRKAETFLRLCCASLAQSGRILVIMHSPRKHAATLDVCRHSCAVVDEVVIGSRVYLTLGQHASLRS